MPLFHVTVIETFETVYAIEADHEGDAEDRAIESNEEKSQHNVVSDFCAERVCIVVEEVTDAHAV